MQISKRIPQEVKEFLLVSSETTEDTYHRTPAGWLHIAVRHTPGNLCWHETNRSIITFNQAYNAWIESNDNARNSI